MLLDSVEVLFKAGDGGNGKVSFRKIGKGPDGGNGGKGGSVYLEALDDIKLLNQFASKKEFMADDGEGGGASNKAGKNGNDVTFYIPVGTSIIDRKTGRLIVELNQRKDKIILCRGGAGGKGNWEFRSPTLTTPKFAKHGESGEVKDLILSLRLIADFGFIGLPNAGKTSLLNELTNANAKTADYPFTTLSPNLGVFEQKVLADIPGLIEGASAGRGLGIGFLKHIEKVKGLLHCIDAQSSDVAKDYETVRSELGKFNPGLLQKKEMIFLTKSDLLDKKEVNKKVKILKKRAEIVLPISIHDFESIAKLKKLLQ